MFMEEIMSMKSYVDQVRLFWFVGDSISSLKEYKYYLLKINNVYELSSPFNNLSSRVQHYDLKKFHLHTSLSLNNLAFKVQSYDLTKYYYDIR
jgi:hypothetical protein